MLRAFNPLRNMCTFVSSSRYLGREVTRYAFFSAIPQNKFDSQFVQDKLDKALALLQTKTIFAKTREVFHELDTYLMKHGFDKHLLPAQKMQLAKLYSELGNQNFVFGRTSNDQDDPGSIQAFLYLQKARALAPESPEVKEILLSMWADTQPTTLKEILSGKWPSCDLQGDALNKFDSQFVQSKLDQVAMLHEENDFKRTREVFHELDNYLMIHGFDRYLQPAQKKQLAEFYSKLGEQLFTFESTSDDQDEPGSRRAFSYLQKARALTPKNQEIKMTLLGMQADTQPTTREENLSGKKPSRDLRGEALKKTCEREVIEDASETLEKEDDGCNIARPLTISLTS